MTRTPIHPIYRLALPALLLVLLGVWRADAATGPQPVVDGYYARWLAGVKPLILDVERKAFLALDDNARREIFIRRFWQARGLASADAADGFLRRWHLSFEEAQQRFETLDDDRAQALLMAGKPASVVVFPGCRNVIRPLRIWTFGPWHAMRAKREAKEEPEVRKAAAEDGLFLVFYLEGGTTGSYRLWSPGDGTAAVMFSGPARDGAWPVEELIDYARAKGCFRFLRTETGAFAAALRRASGPGELRRLTLPASPDAGWLEQLAAELKGGAPDLPGGPVEILFPGRYQMKTIVHGRVSIPVEEVGRNAEGLLFDRIVISGDVKMGARLIDGFRVVHLLAGSQPAAAAVTLDFYRRLRPGTYSLSLRVEDANGLGLVREERELAVPRLENEAAAPAGHRLGLPGLTRSQVGVLTTLPSIEILPLGEELVVGDVEIEAVTTGGPIERIELRLDGAVAAVDSEPPWAAVLRLGTQPRPHRVEALALDPAGREIARDAVTLNAGPPRFAVRLLEPRPGSTGGRARVEVDVPRGEVLDNVELYLNRQHLATFTEARFVHPLPQHQPGVTTYVRAVATLKSGESMEDLVFLHSSAALEQIDVQLVELYTSVLDDQGRFVDGLTSEDFRVLEDGSPQTIRRFDTVENLAINVALLMDVSTSMRKKIRIATRSAQRFFETVLTPKDLASLLTFNHDIRRIVPFTNDALDLAYGASGFRAWGTTRLNDGVIYAVHSFGGLEGKRALVLLSDGQDVDSDFYFKQVLETTLRSGVAVYPIALGLEGADLERLAAASGGRFFRIGGVSELDRIYRRIEEELRSQYLLVYEPPPIGHRHDFRRVEVEVLAPGLRTRSIHGYYP